MIPFLDLQSYHSLRRDSYLAAIAGVLDSGWFILGAQLEAFEREFAAFCGAAGCAGVGTGLDALRLILQARGIGPGDEVIVPAHTFIATFLAVSSLGAKPIPIEPDPETMNIDVRRVEHAISKNTKAIIGVHLYGRPCDMTALREIANRHGLTLIEDAAQAHGAALSGARAGVLGDAAAFSFYPGKNLGALGDGGAIVSNDTDLIARVKRLRNYGSEKKYVHLEQGGNSRLDELQAAVLRTKLRYLEDDNARRRDIVSIYHVEINHPRITLPLSDDGVYQSAWHLFVIRTDARDALKQYLDQCGVETAIHYPIACHLQQAYRETYRDVRLPVAESMVQRVLSLPLSPVMRDEEVNAVVTAINAWPA